MRRKISYSKTTDLSAAIATLIEAVPDPAAGLSDEVFYYVSRTTPLVNVDILIKDERGRTLLAWRDDKFAGLGWHVPGGIVRFRETMETRIAKVAEAEIGSPVDFDPAPLAIHQMIHRERAVRGHFISFLYRCSLPGGFEPANQGVMAGEKGYLKWHLGCPNDLLAIHEVYRDFITSDSERPLKQGVVYIP